MMGLWDHLTPDEISRRTKNYGLAGGYLVPPAEPGVMTCPLCDGTGTLAPPRKQASE